MLRKMKTKLRFLKDIRYDVGKGDKKSARYRTIKRIMRVKRMYLAEV